MALAAMDGNEDLVRLFLEKVDPNDESYWERTKEPVSLAAEKGYKSIVQMLLDHGAAVYKYNPSSETTNTPLEIAVRYEADLDTIKLLSKSHDDEQFRNDVGPTALSVAC